MRDEVFKALSDPTRRSIFERLCREGEKTVTVLTAGTSVSQPVVSKHLAALKRAGLVSDRHEGRQSHYRAEYTALILLIDWAKELNGFWEQKFDALEDLLKRMDQ